MNRGDHPDSLRKQQPSAQWQPQQPSSYQQHQHQHQHQHHQQQQQQQQQQQGYSPQRPLHPSVSSSPSAANRSTSPQPSSPVSPSMHINTKSGGANVNQQQQRSNPSSPATGSAGNAMEIAARHYESLQQYLLAHILKG